MTWGAGKFGQLGNGRREDCVQLQDIRHHVPAESGEPIQVSAGCGHSGFVTSKGHAFTCGDNRYGQLGRHKDKHRQSAKNLLLPHFLATWEDRQGGINPSQL